MPTPVTLRWRQHMLVGLIGIAPLLVGSVHIAVTTFLTAGLAVLMLQTVGKDRSDVTLRFSFVGIPLAVAWVMTCLQCIPLPPELLAWLSPPTSHWVREVHPSLRAWYPVTLDLPATCHALVKLTAMLLVSVLIPTLYKEQERWHVVRAVGLSGAVMVLVGVLHAFLGWHRPWGLFGPIDQPPRVFVAAFVNPNHLAGYLGFVFFVCMGNAARVRGRMALGWWAIGMGSAIGVLLTLSRGGTITFCAALVVWLVGIACAQAKTRAGRVLFSLLTASALLATVGGVARQVSGSAIVHELWTVSTQGLESKYDLWLQSLQMIQAYWRTGIGAGAMATVYPAFSPATDALTFHYVENQYLQALMDWGVPGGGLILLLGVAALVIMCRRAWHDPVAWSSLTGIVFLALHNLCDFNSAMLGVALPATAVCATLAPVHAPVSTGWRRMGAMVLAILMMASWYANWHTYARDTARLRRHLQSQPLTEFQIEAMTEETMHRHPVDHVLPLLAAEKMMQEFPASRRTLHWINLGMERAPGSYLPHIMAARALWRMGTQQQALSEYVYALQAIEPARDQKPEMILREITHLGHGMAMLRTLPARDPELRCRIGAFMLDAKAYEDVLAYMSDNDACSALLRAKAAYARGDYVTAVAASRQAMQHEPVDLDVYMIAGRALNALAQPEDALRILEEGIRVGDPNNTELLFEDTMLILMSQQRIPMAIARSEEFLARAHRPDVVGRLYAMRATLFADQQLYAQALENAHRARGAAPRDPVMWKAVIDICRRQGRTEDAQRELERGIAEGILDRP